MQKNITTMLVLLFTITTIVNAGWYEDLNSIDINHLNDEEYIGSSKCVILEFVAPWCRYSKDLAPVWQELSDYYNNNETLKDSVLIGKVNCDAEISLCEKYNITGYPTIWNFQPGDPEGKEVNIITLDELKKWINENCYNLQ